MGGQGRRGPGCFSKGLWLRMWSGSRRGRRDWVPGVSPPGPCLRRGDGLALVWAGLSPRWRAPTAAVRRHRPAPGATAGKLGSDETLIGSFRSSRGTNALSRSLTLCVSSGRPAQ